MRPSTEKETGRIESKPTPACLLSLPGPSHHPPSEEVNEKEGNREKEKERGREEKKKRCSKGRRGGVERLERAE